MKRLLGLLVSLILLVLIWWQVDADAVLRAAGAANPYWLGLGLSAVVPLTLATAWRFQLLSRTPLGLGTSTRLILSAATLNLFLPSKMGDIAKSVVLVRRHGFDPSLSVALVVLEKMLDMASLLFWGVLALVWIAGAEPWLWLAAAGVGGLLALLLVLLLPLKGVPELLGTLAPRLPGKVGRAVAGFGGEWAAVTAWFWSRPRRAGGVLLLSLGLWGAHLGQFWLFARGLAYVPLLDNMAFATLAILAGLLPFTIAGVGTRDAAIVLLYQPWLTGSQGAVLGVLATLRYVLPALAGLPFVSDFWKRREART